MGSIILVGPLLIQRIDEGRTIAVPGVTVATFCSYLPEMSARHTIAVAYERFAVVQVVISCLEGSGGIGIFHEFGGAEW